MEGKPVIAMAHRLSTIARMDRLLVMEKGKIVESGTHAELLALGGHYEKLWRHQSGGFLANELADAVDEELTGELIEEARTEKEAYKLLEKERNSGMVLATK